jgi:hypothetical protein
MEGIYVSCDQCSEVGIGLKTGGVAFDVTASEAIRDLGWQERDFGVICAACVEYEEIGRQEEEAAGISSGCGIQTFAEAAALTLGATDLESQQAARAFHEPHPEGIQVVKDLGFSPEQKKAYKDPSRRARSKKSHA